MLTLLIVVVYCVCCLCAGFLVLRLLCLRSWNLVPTGGMAFMSTAFILGQAVLANVWLLLGLQSWLQPTVVSLVLLACIIAGAPLARGAFAGLPSKIWDELEWWSEQSVTLRLIIAATVFLFGLFAIGAFVEPPVHDAEAFYMVYPKIIAASERLVPMSTYWSFSQIGLMGEMHFAALLQLSGVHAAKLFVWFISLSAAAMLVAVSAEVGIGRVGQWFAVIILLTSNTFARYITNGAVDLFAAALGIAAFYWALKASEAAWRNPALAITGLCTGFAVVAKLPYAATLLPSIFVLVLGRQYLAATHTNERVSRSLVTAGALLALWITIAAIPHMTKNAIFFGAPLAPLIGPPELKALTEQAWFSAKTALWIILTYPFALVFGHYPMQGGRLSLLWLLLLPLALLVPRAKPILHSSLAQLTLAAVFGTALWTALKPFVFAPRYMLATLLMFIPIAARAAEHAYQSESKGRWLRATVISLLVLALIAATHRPLKKWPAYLVQYAKGELSECELGSRYCPGLTQLNELAVPGARIYFAAYHGYWLRADLLQCRQQREDGRLLGAAQTTKAKWAALSDQGFQYLIIDKLTHRPALVSFDKSQAPDWLGIETIWDDASLVIYKLASRRQEHTPNVACRQVSGPAWDPVAVTKPVALN